MIWFLFAFGTEEEKNEFLAFYNKWNTYMYCAANKILRNSPDTEDAVSNAFLFLAQNFDKIGDPFGEQAGAYAVMTATGCAKRLLRDRDRFPAAELPDDLPSEENVEDAFFESVRREDLKTAIAELPESLQIPFLLRYAQGLNARQIAGMYGVSPESVRKRLERTRRLLRDRLTEMETEGCE